MANETTNITTSKKTTIIHSDSSQYFSYSPIGSDVNVYVNSKKLSESSTNQIEPINGCFLIYIDAPYNVYQVTVNVGEDVLTYQSQKSSILSLFQNTNRISNMMDDDTSFMLLRANPKLTGNVKVVVDSESNMYLDTFKVSNSLSRIEYRKIPVNPDEYYGRTLMTKFRGIATEDFYKVEDSCYDIFTPANNLDEQYYDKYNCGVRTNDDKMYNENYSMLAPLCIRRKLPDFFLVIKIKYYESNIEMLHLKDETFFLNSDNCEIVKCFDLRDETPIGKYIRSIYEHQLGFVGDAFAGESVNRMNAFNGISLDRGVVTKMYESGHSMDLVTNQVAMNDYYTRGFERNRIVSKDIINFEFMFDDPSENLFSINNYYGIYVKLNDDGKTFSCIDSSGNENIFDMDVNGKSFNPSAYKTVFYGISTPDGFERLSTNIYNDQHIQEYNRKPDKNVATLNITDISKYSDGNHLFVSMQMNDVLDPGEHYRIIDKEDRKIYEVIISNASSYDGFSDFSYDDVFYDKLEYRVTRISILNIDYRNVVDEDTKKELTIKQSSLLAKAFNMFETNGKMTAFYDNEGGVSIVIRKRRSASSFQSFIFEKVLSICGFNDTNDNIISITDKTDPDYYVDNSSYIFGVESLKRTIISPDTSNGNEMFYPIGFESMGKRLAYITYFISVPSKTGKSFPVLADSDINDIVTMYGTLIYSIKYQSPDQKYEIMGKNIVIQNITGLSSTVEKNIFLNTMYSYSVLGFGQKRNYYIVFGTEPKITLNDKVNIFQNYPLKVGICSILQIKDTYNSVIDGKNQYMLSGGNDFVSTQGNISETLGEYQNLGNIYEKQLAEYTEENFMNYLDEFNTYTPSYTYNLATDTSLGYYLYSLLSKGHRKMDVPVTVPVCCKWKSVGTDHSGNRLRVMYNIIGEKQDNIYPQPWRPILAQGFDSYLLTKDPSTHIGLISANLASSVSSSNKYIKNYNSSNDYPTFSELLHNGNCSLDDLVFYSTNQDCRYSKVYDYENNSIEFVSGGTKIRLRTMDKSKLDLNKCVGYSAILVCMDGNNPRHPSTYELFIDEKNEQLALFVFNGTGSDNIKIDAPTLPYDYFEVKHSTSIYNGIYDSSDNTWNFIDDGFISQDLWDFKKKTFVENEYENYHVFMVSIPHEFGIAEDPYVMVSGNLVGFYKKNGNIYMKLGSVEAYRNGIQTTVDYATNAINAVDMYILADSVSLANESPIRTKTISLEDMKKLTKEYSVFIKRENGTYEYDNSDRILQIGFVDPFSTKRKQDSSVYSTYGYTHPSYITPVFNNTLPFVCYNNDIQSLSRMFNTCFNAANILLDNRSKIDNIKQTWMRKVIDLDSVMTSMNITGEYEHTKVAVLYGIYTNLIPNTLTLYKEYKDSYENRFYLEKIDTVGNLMKTYKVSFSGDNLFQGDIKSYIWGTKDSNITLNGSFCTTNIVKTGGLYSGTIIIPQSAINQGQIRIGDTFSIACTTYSFKVDRPITGIIGKYNNFTQFYAYNSANVKISEFGTTPASAPYFDGYDQETQIMFLRFPQSNTNIIDTELAYFLPVTGNPYIGQEGNNDRGSSPSGSGNISDQKIWFTSNTGNVTYAPLGRSNNINFTIDSIEDMKTYSSVTLTFRGNTPSTPMPEENNVLRSDEFEISTKGRTVEEIYDDSSTYSDEYYTTTGLTLYRDLNPIMPYWYTKICRLFNNFDNYVDYYGAFSGYEKNVFLASRGINLKTYDSDGGIKSSVTIDEWVDTKIYDNDNMIELDITKSVENMINKSVGYSSSWSRLSSVLNPESGINLDYTKFKTKYIENSIMRFVIINGSLPFTLYVDNTSTSLGFYNEQPKSKTTVVKNSSNSIISKNGKYYVILKKLEPKKYYATLEIKLLNK